jgi:O-antigen/teichoic acid export membrane protein
MFKIIRTLFERLTPRGTTEQRAARSGLWAAGINISDRALQLSKVVIVARLLSPGAIGLYGIALLVVHSIRWFTVLGFDQALIQNRKENIDSYLNTTWILKITRGFFIAIITFASAPYLASFFGEPQSEALIQAIGVYPLIIGFQNPAVVYFQKNLDFHKEFIYSVGGRLADFFVAVSFAIIFRNVWALIAGIIATNLTKVFISYFIHGYRPRIEFERQKAEDMFDFGKWMFISSVFTFLYSQGDDAFVGWAFAASTLGFYQISYRFSNAPATEVAQVISRVAFPALSKVQEDINQLTEGYLRVLQLSTATSLPIALGIISVAPQFVRTVFGDQWSPMIPLVKILAIYGAVRTFEANNGAVFRAVGKPNMEVKVKICKTVIIVLIIYPAAEIFDILGVAYAIIASSIIVLPVSAYLIISVTEVNVRIITKIITPPLIGSIGMYIIVVNTGNYLGGVHDIIELVLLVFVGIVVYVLIMALIEYLFEYEFIELYSNLLNKI